MRETLAATEDKLKSALVQAGYYRDAEREAFEKVGVHRLTYEI